MANQFTSVKTLFRPEPLKGTLRGDVYRFLLDNRTPGAHVVNIKSLYEKHGYSRTSKALHDLKKYYGFVIVKAGYPCCFKVDKKVNRRIDKYEGPPLDSKY